MGNPVMRKLACQGEDYFLHLRKTIFFNTKNGSHKINELDTVSLFQTSAGNSPIRFAAFRK